MWKVQTSFMLIVKYHLWFRTSLPIPSIPLRRTHAVGCLAGSGVGRRCCYWTRRRERACAQSEYSQSLCIFRLPTCVQERHRAWFGFIREWGREGRALCDWLQCVKPMIWTKVFSAVLLCTRSRFGRRSNLS